MHKSIFYFVCLVFGVIVVLYLATSHKGISVHSNPGIVIILNGASAAGKSTLQKELQKLFPIPYLGIGLDTFFVGVLPERFVLGPNLEGDVPQEKIMQGVPSISETGHRLFTLSVGPLGDQVIHGMHHALAAYAQQENNLIVDYIAYKKEWIPDLVNALKGLTVYVIGVDCPLDILEERERARGRSFVEGHARSHYSSVHQNMSNSYDLRVDTGANSASELAKKIYDFIQQNPQPTAFTRLAADK